MFSYNSYLKCKQWQKQKKCTSYFRRAQSKFVIIPTSISLSLPSSPLSMQPAHGSTVLFILCSNRISLDQGILE